MEINKNNGWVMLGLHDNGGKFTTETGGEFAKTCLSDPSLCADGLTLGMWLKLSE